MSTRVQIGPNEARDVEVVSDTLLRARYMGGGLGDEDVIVTTPAGSATATGAFHATRPPEAPRPPTIVAVTPNRGPGGTLVEIEGSGFEA